MIGQIISHKRVVEKLGEGAIGVASGYGVTCQVLAHKSRHSGFRACATDSGREAKGEAETTVDHADIRGLATA